jgi:hypothetical protein
MFTILVKRAAELVGCRPGSPEEEEFDRLVNAIEAYEAKRWPEGRPSAVELFGNRPTIVECVTVPTSAGVSVNA